MQFSAASCTVLANFGRSYTILHSSLYFCKISHDNALFLQTFDGSCTILNFFLQRPVQSCIALARLIIIWKSAAMMHFSCRAWTMTLFVEETCRGSCTITLCSRKVLQKLGRYCICRVGKQSCKKFAYITFLFQFFASSCLTRHFCKKNIAWNLNYSSVWIDCDKIVLYAKFDKANIVN